MSTAVSFPALLQRFFTGRLMQQRRASPHTIASYRDTFRLLLRFAQGQLGKAPTQLAFEQVDALLIVAFLDDPSATAASQPAVATCGSRRSARSSATPLSRLPLMQNRSSEYSPFPARDLPAPRSVS